MKNPSVYTFTAVSGASRMIAGGKEAFSAVCGEGGIALSFYYSVREQPLVLRADSGDKITLIVSPCRIALYADGRLADEEWCFGEPLFGNLTEASGAIKIYEDTNFTERKDEKTVIRSFKGAENIRVSGANIGDCMPYSDGVDSGVYHLFYLYDRHHHKSKWGLGAHQWAHVSTSDFITWDEHPMAIAIDEGWEGSICTGSVMKVGEKYYAWYAARMSDHSPARLTYSVSDDNVHFKKSGKFFTLPSAYEPTSARDPKVFAFGGEYHMFVTTTYLENGRGCLAHLTSPDMENWKDRGAVIVWKDKSQPECSDWFRFGGKYYLVFSIGGKARYLVSDAPFTFIQPDETESNVIPCGRVPKAAFLNGRLIFCGFIGEEGYAGSLIAAEAFSEPDGRLIFKPIHF